MRKNIRYDETFKDFMEFQGQKMQDWYHEGGGKGAYVIGYTPVRKAIIRVETTDGRKYDYSDTCQYGLRFVDRESASRFNDEYCREEFAKALTNIMLEENITPSELARLTGISPSRINRYWKGSATPDITDVAKIATALGRYSGDLLDCM